MNEDGFNENGVIKIYSSLVKLDYNILPDALMHTRINILMKYMVGVSSDWLSLYACMC